MPKGGRARVHELFAESLERLQADAPSVRDELAGYHLEQAYRYRRELEGATESTRQLGVAAAARLGAAGRRALSRGDLGAAVGLLERAVRVTPPEELSRLELLA